MNDELTFTMASNRSKVILGVIGTFSILVLIAGAVMLAIGITKFNDAKTTISASTLTAHITTTVANNNITQAQTSSTVNTSVIPQTSSTESTASSAKTSTSTLIFATSTLLTSQTQSTIASAPTTSIPSMNSVPTTAIPSMNLSTYPSSSSTLESSLTSLFTTSSQLSTQPSLNTVLPTTPFNNQPKCQRDVAILIDNSRMVGNLTDFQKQMKFITDKLISNWSVNPNATEAAALLYNTQQPKVIGRPFLYYNVKTLILDLQDQLQSFTYFQSDISFGISTLKQNLQNRRSHIPLTTILFTYSSEYNDIISAAPEIPSLNSALIIVAVGPNANLNILQYLSGTVVLSNTDYSNAGLVNTINTAICDPSDPPNPIPSPTTTPPKTKTTPASSAPYSPCQKFISFIIDASNDLTDGQFAMQKGAIGLGLPQANHYERLAFGYYSSTANMFDFGRFDSDTSFTNAIAGTKKTNNPPNITRALQAADIGLSFNSTIGTSTIIFITKPDPVDITSAIPFAQSLQSKGKLTVVALLNANLTLIKQLTSNIVVWSDMGSYNSTTWIPDMQNAFGCLTVTTTSSPSQPPTAASTKKPRKKTFPLIVRQKWSISAPGNNYWPCESDIVIAVDVSSSMSTDAFLAEGLFIVINFVNYNWSHYERVGLMSYADGYNRVFKYDTFNNDSTINNPVLQMAQQNGKNNVTNGMSTLVTNFSQGKHSIRNTVFFTSASDPDDVTKALPFATQINQKGPLIIIAYREDSNVTELQRLNPAKIIHINPNTFPSEYHNFTISEEIYSAFQCSNLRQSDDVIFNRKQ